MLNFPVEPHYSTFNAVVKKVLNVHAPLKTKYVRANDGPFMTKAQRKAIMLRTHLRNRYNKERKPGNWNAFKKQRNKCIKTLWQAERDYYGNLDVKSITDNRKFWKTVKLLFSEEVQTSSHITLLDNGSLISDDFQVAEMMNDYFIYITETLGISKDVGNVSTIIEDTDYVERAIRKHRSHPNIQRIRANASQANEFDCQKTSVMEVEQQIRKLKPKKATPYGKVPAKMLKQNSSIFSDYLTSFFNNMVECYEFPGELKEGEITSLFRNQDALTKKNYRPITILTSESKIFQRITCEQIKVFFPFSHYLCGFREGYSTHHALLRLLETCKDFLDKKGYVGAVLMDLSKAIDCLYHDLLLAKLDAYGFSHSALILICSYLSDRRQRVKVNGAFSTWCYSKIGVPQGSVVGPLLFNIFINDIFYLVNDTEVCNYANDTTLYVGDKNLRKGLANLEKDTLLLSEWFSDNYMKLNEEKSHLLYSEQKAMEWH